MNSRLLVLTLVVSTSIAAGCGSSDGGGSTGKQSGGAKTTATTTSTAMTTTATTPPTATGSSSDCSAAGTALRVVDTGGLPPAVATTRSDVQTAAANCDYDALQAIIDRHPDQFQFQVGAAAKGSATSYWKSVDAKEHVMLRLTQLLSTKGAELTEGAVVTHVWPAVHAGRRTDADWQELVESGAYTEQEVAAFRQDDLYFGYRVGILPDGTWSYFVAGD